MNGTVIYHHGYKAELTGAKTSLYGAEWYLGVWKDGPDKGKTGYFSVDHYKSQVEGI